LAFSTKKRGFQKIENQHLETAIADTGGNNLNCTNGKNRHICQSSHIQDATRTENIFQQFAPGL